MVVPNWIMVGAAIMLGCLASGRATALPYQPDVPGSPSAGGYSEMQFAPDHFQIIISASRGTSHKKLEAVAMRRSAEISVQQGYPGFRVIRRTFVDSVHTAEGAGGRVRATSLPGFDDWRDYGRPGPLETAVEMPADPAWLLADPNHRTFGRDELNFEIKLSRSRDNDIFEATEFLQPK